MISTATPGVEQVVDHLHGLDAVVGQQVALALAGDGAGRRGLDHGRECDVPERLVDDDAVEPEHLREVGRAGAVHALHVRQIGALPEPRVGETPERLTHRDHVRPGRVGDAVQLEHGRGAVHLDAGGLQLLDHACRLQRRALLRCGGRDQVDLGEGDVPVRLRDALHSAAELLGLVVQQLHLVVGGVERAGPGGPEVAGGAGGVARRRLERHARRAVVHRVHRRVDRAVVLEPALQVAVGDLDRPPRLDVDARLHRQRRRQRGPDEEVELVVRVVRGGARLHEVVRVVAVQVEEDGRHPAGDLGRGGLRLRLRRQQEVAVHVEPVRVGARVGDAPVGVLADVEEDDALVEDALRLEVVLTGGRQPAQHDETGVDPVGLVAVDRAVDEDRHLDVAGRRGELCLGRGRVVEHELPEVEVAVEVGEHIGPGHDDQIEVVAPRRSAHDLVADPVARGDELVEDRLDLFVRDFAFEVRPPLADAGGRRTGREPQQEQHGESAEQQNGEPSHGPPS